MSAVRRGYVVAPPSRHYFGNRYEWECTCHPEDIPMVEAPEWLIRLASMRKKSKGRWGSTLQANPSYRREERDPVQRGVPSQRPRLSKGEG